MKKRVFMLMAYLFLISAVYSAGQEQNSFAIIGEWLQVGRDDGRLIIINFSDNQMTIQDLMDDYADFLSSVGCTINNGTIVFYDGNLWNYTLIDNDTLSIDFSEMLHGEFTGNKLIRTFKRLRQDISLSGIFYPESADEIIDDDSYTYTEFIDGQKGRMSLLGFIVPFEYEIHGIYLVAKFGKEYLRKIFIIKSDSIIEELEGYNGFAGGDILRKKQ